MDEVRGKIRSSCLVAGVALLAIALLLGIGTASRIAGWWTDGSTLADADFVRRGVGLLSEALLIALAVYIAFVFERIAREETPFFPELPRMIKAAAAFLFLALAAPKWLGNAILSFQEGTLVGALIDEGVIFAFVLAAVVFCLGRIFEYGCLVQDENFEII
ncbi:hypothetical protein [Arabiibacter massiliensis]|uniref:hypothetical protein n=1 Tax=Arabiibacter massiliensis TaxID=1870985 RepID=UPI0009BC1149|nr:hypothetical protein [Arabiibacter massiliensis]